MNKSCKDLGVDKNTIAGTAVIADVIIAGGEDGEFGELPPIGKKQTLQIHHPQSIISSRLVDVERGLAPVVARLGGVLQEPKSGRANHCPQGPVIDI